MQTATPSSAPPSPTRTRLASPAEASVESRPDARS